MHEETTKAHGRTETRRIEVFEPGHVRWPGLRQWGLLTRIRTEMKTGRTTTETLPFIASLGRTQATPEALLGYNRKHWAVENNLHRNRDTLLKEDASSLRKGHSPQANAALRNLALHLLAKLNPSPTIAREIAQNDKNKTLQLLGLVIK